MAFFYYPITLHRDGATSTIIAPSASSLPLQFDITDQVIILTSGAKQEQGMYLWDGRYWRLTIPYEDICAAVIGGDQIVLYYDVDTTTVVPQDAITYQNGFQVPLTQLVPHPNVVYGLRIPHANAGGNGTVSSVNGQLPDAAGNVTLNISNIPGLQQALNDLGKVKTVNQVQPDANGNVTINIADIPQLQAILDSKGTVKSVNDTLPDGNGNVVLYIADIPCLQEELDKKGNTKSVNGVTPNPTTGDIDLEIADIPGLPEALADAGKVKTVNLKGPDGAGNVDLEIADIAGLQQALNDKGGVKTVSGQLPDPSGNVVIQAQDNNGATGTSLITDGGATTGTIKLKTMVPGNLISLTPDVNGNIVVSSSATAGALTAVNSEGTGTSLVDNNGTAGGIATIKSLAAGSNVTITPSGDGKTLTVAANQVLSPATTTTIGGVIIGAGINVDGTGKISLAPPSGVNLGGVKAGTGISIATDGTISATNAGAISSVTNEGTGTGLVDNDGTSGGVATIKSLAAGSNVTITPSGDGKTLTIAANQTLNPATTTTIGGVIVGSGLSVDGTGKIALAAPSGVNLGGVKAGSGITIAEDGTISATGGGAVTSVSGQTGDVVISTVDNNPATGSHSLISNTGATTGTAKLRTLVAGTGVTITNDGNDNLLISSTASGGVTSIATDTSGALTGAITLSAGPSISMSNVGNMIQISGTGVPEAPNDGNGYMRQNLSWAVVPDVANAITSVTGQDGTGAVILVESNPPANSAIIKSLVAGQNISFSEDSGLITVSASIPAGTVATVNGISPNGSGNVTLTAANVNAVPIAGGVTMTGPLNFGSQVVNGIPTPANPSDAVPLSYITALTIDQGTF